MSGLITKVSPEVITSWLRYISVV